MAQPLPASKGGVSFDRMDVSFEGAVIERVDLDALKARLSSRAVADCIAEKVPQDARMVIESVRVQRARYRLWRGTTMVKPDDGELRRLGLGGRGDFVPAPAASSSKVRSTSRINRRSGWR